jgi:hypothetical protein
MRRVPRLAVLVPIVVLSACDSSVGQLSKAADSARSATERMADNGDAASAAREAQVFADAQSIEDKAADRAAAEENGGRPRYEIRKEGDSWTVYDTANHRPVRVGPKLQTGLSHDKAQAVFDDLLSDEGQTTASGPLKLGRGVQR